MVKRPAALKKPAGSPGMVRAVKKPAGTPGMVRSVLKKPAGSFGMVRAVKKKPAGSFGMVRAVKRPENENLRLIQPSTCVSRRKGERRDEASSSDSSAEVPHGPLWRPSGPPVPTPAKVYPCHRLEEARQDRHGRQCPGHYGDHVWCHCGLLRVGDRGISTSISDAGKASAAAAPPNPMSSGKAPAAAPPDPRPSGIAHIRGRQGRQQQLHLQIRGRQGRHGQLHLQIRRRQGRHQQLHLQIRRFRSRSSP